jgi:hypothetical protein
VYRFYLPILVFLIWNSSLPAGEFQFKDGDRVALVGSTLIEREQKYGYWELAITTRHHDKNIIFRNLGWSGDTVWGESRVGFDLDNPQKGFERLRDAVLAVKPTVIIVGYGTNESFAGEAGLPRFKEGMNKLLDAVAPTKARIILLAPLPPLKTPSRFPEFNERTKKVAMYRDAIAEIAKTKSHYFLDLFRLRFFNSWSWRPFSDNSLHLTEFGYWLYAEGMAERLGLRSAFRLIDMDLATKKIQSKQAEIEMPDIEARKFQAKAAALGVAWPHARKQSMQTTSSYVNPHQPTDEPQSTPICEPEFWFRINALPGGEFALKTDGQVVATGDAKEWEFGRVVTTGPEFDQSEKLRRLIVEKNQLYFHRYRPQNETYLFGFRKYEQGNNAVEVPQFDALIEAKEKEIAKLRVPVKHTYELVPVK